MQKKPIVNCLKCGNPLLPYLVSDFTYFYGDVGCPNCGTKHVAFYDSESNAWRLSIKEEKTTKQQKEDLEDKK